MEIYDAELKGVRARGFLQDQRFIVLAESQAVGDKQVQSSLGEKRGRIRIRRELIQSKRLIPAGSSYRFAINVDFNSPSEAASIIWGCNRNGRKDFGIDGHLPESHVLHFQIDSPRAIEGYKRDQLFQVADRDRSLVAQRKEYDDYTCQACKFRLCLSGHFVIECHHLNPIVLGERETALTDLVCLCPTCHRIAHLREPIYSVEEIMRIRGSQVADAMSVCPRSSLFD